MKKYYLMAILCAFIMGCDDDDNGSSGKQNGGNTSETSSCKPDSYQSECNDTNGKAGYKVCQLTEEGTYKETDVICESGETCHISQGKPACLKKCNTENEVISESCRMTPDESNSASLVPQKVTSVCKKLDDALYIVDEEEQCEGVCYNNECHVEGDECKARTSDQNTVIGCHGNDLYVCAKDQKIYKQKCPKEGLCQISSKNHYYCADTCNNPDDRSTKYVCSRIGDYRIATKCTKTTEDSQYLLNTEDLPKDSHSDNKYCDKGELHSYPSQVSCGGYCAESCYGTMALPWLQKGWGFIDCGVSACYVTSKISPDGNGYVECMEPCSEIGEEKTSCGAFFGDDKTKKMRATYECTAFTTGKFFKTVKVDEEGCF